MNILFLCTGNSCRSQMAEGWGKKLHGDKFKFFSAGPTTHGLNPRAVTAMAKNDIDISGHKSQTTEDILKDNPGMKFDLVVTVCSDAHENCPIFPGGKVIHHGFEDPPRLTMEMTDEDQIQAIYDRVCLEIKDFVLNIEQHL